MTRLPNCTFRSGAGTAPVLSTACNLACALVFVLWASAVSAAGPAPIYAGPTGGLYESLGSLGTQYWPALLGITLVSLLAAAGCALSLVRRRRAYTDLVTLLQRAAPSASRGDAPADLLNAIIAQRENATKDIAAQKARAEDAEATLAALTRSLTVLGEGALAEACDMAENAAEGAARDALSRALADLNSWQVEFGALAVGVDGSTAEITQATDDLSKRTETQAATLKKRAQP
jgi:hypothetical protein